MSDIPDPATDFVGSVRWLMQKMDSIERQVKEHEDRKLLAAEAARALGFNSRFFHGKPWCIPNFAAAGSRFPLSTWREWNARPEHERRAEWDKIPASQRRKTRVTI